MKLVLILLASCAVTPPSDPKSPASPQAQTGRLAGAPATLRQGVAIYADVPALRIEPMPMHHHHGS